MLRPIVERIGDYPKPRADLRFIALVRDAFKYAGRCSADRRLVRRPDLRQPTRGLPAVIGAAAPRLGEPKASVG
jgi:hypothetical protein